jgi:hypothetical protein
MNSSNSSSNSSENAEMAAEVRTHDIPIAEVMVDFMLTSWAPSPLEGVKSSWIHPLE